MDFWDVFIKEEELANAAALQLLSEFLPDINNNKYSMAVYTDFIDFNEIDSDEFLIAMSILDNIDTMEEMGKKLTPSSILLLYKFYNMLENDFEIAAHRVLKLFGCKSMKIKADESLIDDFHNAVRIYSNFGVTEYLKALNFDAPSGKMLVVYNKQIIVYYLKEGEEETEI